MRQLYDTTNTTTTIDKKVSNIMFLITDPITFNLLKEISKNEEPGTDILITRLNLTRRQYYKRISKLVKTGLVKRQNGKYHLPIFGKLIYQAQTDLETKINNIIEQSSQLNALEIMRHDLPKEQFCIIIEQLVQNEDVKNTLLKRYQAGE